MSKEDKTDWTEEEFNTSDTEEEFDTIEPNEITDTVEPDVMDLDLDEPDVMDLNLDDTDEEDPDSGEAESAGNGKGKKKWTASNLILLLVGIAMIGYAAYRIGSLLLNYNNSNQEYDEIADDFVTVNSGNSGTNELGTDGASTEDADSYVSSGQDWSTKAATIWYEMVSVDISGLSKKYPDVVAWLYQEGDTTISYPVMYSGDNDTYIHTTYKGSYAYAGSIFMEGVNNPDFNDSHTILYGHNMRNGSMFGTLRYLQTKDNYIEDHGYFQIFLEDEIRRYQVFSYEIVEESSWLYTIPDLESEEYTTLLEKIRSKSEISTDVEVTNEDHILTLSTCYGSNTTRRFVVQAVWMDTYYYDLGMSQTEIDEQEAAEAAAAAAAAEEATEDEPQETEELEFLAQ